jgi:hypothetical protein
MGRQLWDASSQLIPLVFPLFFLFGYQDKTIPFLLFLLYGTSFFCHYHHAWINVDRVMAAVTWTYAIFAYQTLSAKLMLWMGLLLYVYYQLFLPRLYDQITCHMALHAFCYLSIFPEIEPNLQQWVKTFFVPIVQPMK